MANQLSLLPAFRDFDVSGNQCGYYGCSAICQAVISHSVMSVVPEYHGFRALHLSCNRLAFECIEMIGNIISKTGTLKTLELAFCDIDDQVLYIF